MSKIWPLVHTQVPPSATDVVKRDGMWWRKLSDSGQLCYIVGYLDALSLTWKVRSASASAPVLQGDASDELSSWSVRIPPPQFVQSLNEFYAEVKNRPMSLASAIYYVSQRSSDPAADWSGLLERLR